MANLKTGGLPQLLELLASAAVAPSAPTGKRATGEAADAEPSTWAPVV
jgi:hypothetical protein